MDPKEKAKEELKAEEEAKKKGTPAPAGPTGPKLYTPETPASGPNPDNPKVNNAIPEDDSLYNRRSKGITNDFR